MSSYANRVSIVMGWWWCIQRGMNIRLGSYSSSAGYEICGLIGAISAL